MGSLYEDTDEEITIEDHEHYKITKEHEKKSLKWGYNETHKRLSFKRKDGPIRWNDFHEAFDHLINGLVKGHVETTKALFTMVCPKLTTPVRVGFCSVKDITSEKVLSTLENSVESYEDIPLDGPFEIIFKTVKQPPGYKKTQNM